MQILDQSLCGAWGSTLGSQAQIHAFKLWLRVLCFPGVLRAARPRSGARGRRRSWSAENDPSACCPVGIPSAVFLPFGSCCSFLLRQLPVFGLPTTLKMNFIMPVRDPSTGQATPRQGFQPLFFISLTLKAVAALCSCYHPNILELYFYSFTDLVDYFNNFT